MPRITGAETAPLAARTRVEPTAFNAPTMRMDENEAARLVKAARRAARAVDDELPLNAAGRFRRWMFRMTIRAVLILVAVGGALYFARPYLPAWARRPIDRWLDRVSAPLDRD